MPEDLRVALRIDARDRTRPGIRSARRNVRSLSGEVRRLDRAGISVERGVARAATGVDRLGTAASGTAATVRQLHALIIAYGAGRVVSAIVRAGLEMERLDFRFRAAAGSVQAGRREMAFVRIEAERLGIDLVAAADAYSGFAAAARGTALEGQAARDIFIAVAEAARVMGLSADDTSGVLLAMQQIVSKGVVSAEELRGQLGERLPGAFQIAARAMGTTTRELGEMLQRGELLAEDLLPRFAAELRRSVAESVPDATRSAAAEFARLNNAVRDLNAAIAESGMLQFLADVARGAAIAVRALTPDAPPAGTTEEERELVQRLFDAGATRERLLATQGSVAGLDDAAAIARLDAEMDRIEARLAEIYREREAARPQPRATATDADAGPGLGASEFRLAAIARQQQAELETLHRAEERRRRESLDRLVGDYRSYTAALRSIDEAEADLAGPFEAARLAARRWRDETLDALGLAADANDEYARRVDAIFRGQLAQIYAEEADARIEASQRWQDAAIRGLREVAAEARGSGSTIEDAVTGAFRGLEDAIARAVRTGKFEISDLADFVIAEFARIAAQRAIIGPLGGALDSLLGLFGQSGAGAGIGSQFALLHGGGRADAGGVYRTGVDPRAFIGARRFHGGGIAGDEIPAILRRGETVRTPAQERALAAPPNIEVRVINQDGPPRQVADSGLRWDGERWVLTLLLRDARTNGPVTQAMRLAVLGGR